MVNMGRIHFGNGKLCISVQEIFGSLVEWRPPSAPGFDLVAAVTSKLAACHSHSQHRIHHHHLFATTIHHQFTIDAMVPV
jgi:rhamnose utilization protein RhaD (predicted bifunctional aldolase and dehydrogenase)